MELDLNHLFVQAFARVVGAQALPTRGEPDPHFQWGQPFPRREDTTPRNLEAVETLVPFRLKVGAFPVQPARREEHYSSPGEEAFATAWEPYQELFQGVARCLHSDFRLGGLAPGERKEVRGKIYVVPTDVPALLKRYEKDFPEHRGSK